MSEFQDSQDAAYAKNLAQTSVLLIGNARNPCKKKKVAHSGSQRLILYEGKHGVITSLYMVDASNNKNVAWKIHFFQKKIPISKRLNLTINNQNINNLITNHYTLLIISFFNYIFIPVR